MRLLGWQDPALPELLPVARDCMAPSYPELADELRPDLAATRTRRRRRSVARCAAGTTILDTAVARDQGVRRATTLSGDKAFQLHDTYGFPIDLTLEIAAEQGLTRRRGRLPPADGRAAGPGEGRRAGAQDRPRRPVGVPRRSLDARRPVEFTGYAEVAARVAGAGAARSTAAGRRPRARATQVELVLDATPFYAEGGGQQPDTGLISVGRRRASRSSTCSSRSPGLIVHRARVVDGEVRAGETGYAEIDVDAAPGDLAARTPRPTWCTRRCATSSASRRPRRVR